MAARAAQSLALAILLAAAGRAALATPQSVAPAAAPFRLGALQVAALRDADNVVDNDGKTFGVGVNPAEVAAVLRRADAPADKITLSVDALLVRSPQRTMLFDTGLGPHVHGVLLASLAQAGVQPGDITDVFITHAHGDHVGGLMAADGGSAFPHAAIHMSAREWAWMQGQPRMAPLVAVIGPQVRPFEPGGEVAPGVTSVALYGHTPGHVGYEIASQGATLLDIGDIAHSAIVSVARPDWTIQYDQDAAQGRATRQAALTRLAASRQLVFAPHFPFPGVGRIAAAGEGFVWRPGLPGTAAPPSP